MKRSETVVDILNELLTNELTAINQYVLHAETCERWGYDRLATRLRAEAADEREHADMLVERILFLEGAPNMQRYHQVAARGTVREQLAANLEIEYTAVAHLNRGIDIARREHDNATEALMMTILVAEEQGVQWLESQLRLIDSVGEQNYLAQQIA